MGTGKIFYTEGAEGTEFTEHRKRSTGLKPGTYVH
jgi:hypothetical protein